MSVKAMADFDERADSSAAADAARLSALLEALDAAAVGLLAPLIGAVPTRWRDGWSAALDRLAGAAQDLQLSGLAHVARLLHGAVAQMQAVDDDAARVEQAEELAADLIAFCSGQLDGEQLHPLVERLRQWPGLGERIMPALIEPIVARLAQDMQRVRQWAPARDAAPAAAEPEDAAEGAVGEPAISAAHPPITVGADELAMLAEAAEQMDEELAPLLDALVDEGSEPSEAARIDLRRELLEQYADAIERFANAIGYVGLTPVSEALQRLHQRLLRLAETPDALEDRQQRLLRRFPSAWAALFRAPGAATVNAALELLDADSADAGLLDAARVSIASIELVASRRVSLPGEALDAEALSLAIPQDADRNVVDNLLRELPTLSAEFSACIEHVRDGSMDELAAAQRIAHTLKGSANTVGVRGIATLTHRLEDLLQLLEGRPAALHEPVADEPLIDLLADAADCLAEMSEAVAGLGAAPTTAMAMHERIVAAVAALMETAEAAAAAPTDALTTTSVDDAAPGAQRHADADADGDGDAAATAGTVDAGEPVGSVDTVPAIEAHGTVETVYAADTPHMAGPVHSAQMGGMAHTAHAAESARTPTHPADANPATAAPAEAPQEWLRVPASLIERLLAFANEASILLSQAQEQALEVDRGRATLRSGTDQLQDLAGELERLVDIRGLALSDLRARQDFDALELDEYNDLHTVSRRIAESGADGRLIEQQLGSSVSALRDSLSQLERIQVDLREAALQTRMVTVDTVAPRLRRTVRQAARMAGRDVALTIEGEATAVDAQLLTALIEPLAHLLRNAVDHGIEPAELRQAHGKPAQGRIALAFHRDGPDLLIDCSDDGQGLDLPALRARALELGLLDEADAGRSDEELARLALLPGLSTRAQATQLSGRGIGLDVVEQAVREQRGAIEIDTRAGTGTRFRIRVPVRMAALPVMLIRSATHALALSVREVEQILPADRIVEDGDEPRFLVANRLLRLVRLEDVLALPDDAFATEDESAPANRAVLEVRLADGERVALLVPEPGQTRSVVVRRLASFLPPLPGIEGAAVLGDGSVAPVLDLPQLLAARQGRRAAPPLRASTQRAPVCLVVDDSVSVRRTMELFVRDLGFDADTAADGVEALEHARRRTPALVLADLEMPRMNGVELVRALRARPETRSVPVIMITSRSSDKHRQLALDAGVDVLLTKPYTEDALASQIAAVTAARAGGPDRQSGQSGQSGQGGQSGHSGQGG